MTHPLHPLGRSLVCARGFALLVRTGLYHCILLIYLCFCLRVVLEVCWILVRERLLLLASGSQGEHQICGRLGGDDRPHFDC